MNSSNSYDFRLLANGETIHHSGGDAFQLPVEAKERISVSWNDWLELRMKLPGRLGRVRVRIGTTVLKEVVPSNELKSVALGKPFRNELGESVLTVEGADMAAYGPQTDPQAEEPYLYRVVFVLRPHERVERDFQVMLTDVEQIHVGLAQDVVKRGQVPRGILRSAVCTLEPSTQVHVLANVCQRMSESVEQISRQPSSTLTCERKPGRYDPGTKIDMAACRDVAYSQGARLRADGSVVALTKTRLRQPVLTSDIPEHRLIAHALQALSRRARHLEAYSARMRRLYEQEKGRWGGRELSVYDRRFAPRVEILKQVEREAGKLAESFVELVRRHRFLRDASRPRMRFGATPVFLGRPAYRKAYRALLDARQKLGILVDGEALRVNCRSFWQLYEYWCFIKTVSYLRERIGPSEPRDTFSLIDEVYRPELKPGQKFLFFPGDGIRVTVSYEPDILPWDQAAKTNGAYGATLTTHPLRPDIFVEVQHSDGKLVCLAMDSKSTDRFSLVKALNEMSDYSRQVFRLKDARQVVQEVAVLHRDRDKAHCSNLPSGNFPAAGKSFCVTTGILCAPDRIGAFPRELDRYLGSFLKRNGIAVE